MEQQEEEEEDSGLFETPRRSRKRNPPFEIIVHFDQYRRNRRYQGKDMSRSKKVSLSLTTSPQSTSSPADQPRVSTRSCCRPGEPSRATATPAWWGPSFLPCPASANLSPARTSSAPASLTRAAPSSSRLENFKCQKIRNKFPEPDLHLALAYLRPRRYQVHSLASPE